MDLRKCYRSISKNVRTLLLILIVTQIFGLGEASRSRRSPGLLGNIKPPSPPNLLDPSYMFNLTKIQEQINKLGSFSDALEKGLEIERKARLGLQGFVDSVKERIVSLENAVLPDENSYWEESNSCGGIIVSQTGKISYKVETSYELYENCVWTIRANFRSLVKVQLKSHGFELGFDYIAVTEVNANKAPKSYKLNHKGMYVFDGPLLLVSFISDGSGIGLGFSLEFEGVGRNINKNVVYKHFHINELSGTLSAHNMTDSEASTSTAGLQLPSTSSSTQGFTTIVINPEVRNVSQLSLTVNQELMNLQPATCEEASLDFYDYLEMNNTRSRCCGTSCSAPTFRNYNGFVLATLNRQLSLSQKDSSFQFDWNASDPVQRSDSIDTCGGIVAGRLGRISYHLESSYANNERCLWVIKPTGKSRIKLIMRSSTPVDRYDFVTVSTINQDSDIVTTQIAHGPTYNFSGPTIFVTFSSDDSTFGKGLELDWEEFEEFGESIKNQDSVNEPVYFDQDSGTVSLSLEAPSYQVVAINPKYFDGSSIELKLNSVESHPEQEAKEHDSGEHDCDSGSIYVYGNDESNFTLSREYCVSGNEIVPEVFSAVGGMFILLVRIDSPASITKLELTWRKGSPPIQPNLEGLQYVNITDYCGGILVGDAGHIEYKLTSPYEDNARCTWIVESSQLSKISFKLIKDGFESCCDYLIATPLNVETGTLEKSVIISRESRVQTFLTPVVFITFTSDSSLGYSGFRLEFITGGNPMGLNRVGFSHHIWRETPGNVSFVQSDNDNLLDEDETLNKKIVITHVLNSNMDGEVMKLLTIDAQANDFQVDDTAGCVRDSLTFFEVQNPANGDAISESVVGSDEPNSCTCAPEMEKSFKMNFFIAIFKPLNGSSSKANFNFGWKVLDE